MTRTANWMTTMMAVGLVACAGGSEAGRAAAGPVVAETTEPAATDPLVAACEAGTVKSCLSAASSAETAGDIVEAARLYGRACELGDANGCTFAGAALAQAPQHLAAAAAAFEKGCGLGDGASCYGAGLVWSGAFGGDADAERATRAFERGCQRGVAEACGAYANAIEASQPAVAREVREAACQQGDGGSCLAIAARLRAEGDDVGADRYLEVACRDDGRGCTVQGLRLVDSDPAAARALFEKGCVAPLPDADACGWYGWFVYSGAGGVANPEEGAAALRSACDAEGAIACMFEAVILQRQGAPEAAQRLERACELEPAQCEAMKRQVQTLVNDPTRA